MANARIILECPNCKEKKEVENRYDYNSTDQIECECGLKVAKWCWTYVCNKKKLPDESLPFGAKLETDNGICSENVPYHMW